METLKQFTCFILFLASAKCSEFPKVRISSGEIEGLSDVSEGGQTFYSFEGIPYAEPPIGALRFKESVPVKPWKGTWKADTKYTCIQYNHFPAIEGEPVEGTEDCLYLNVYTPNLDSDGNLDVLIFIHGGAFVFGSGALYLPHKLMDKNVVFVSMNYRLGPLGFLSTQDDAVPGNNGLKDQTLALKWIKENIERFGGNPDSITINGMSAGGASVHFHMLNRGSEGLFHRAIATSGCMLNPWVIMERPLERAKELADHVGCPTGDSDEMVDCLRKRPAKQVVGVVGKFQPWLFNPFSPFGAVVDEWATEPVIPKHPMILMKEKKIVNDVPLIISHTADEGLYNGYDYYSEDILEYLDNDWNDIIPHILHYNFTISPAELDEVSRKIRDEYLGSDRLTLETYKRLINLMGDRNFKVDLEKCARLQSASMESPVWYYIFNYRGEHSWSELRTSENIGISHGDDTNYVITTMIDTLSTENDREMTKIMTDMFLTLAKTGKPDIGVEWENVSKETEDGAINYLLINSPTSMVNEKVEEFGNRQFWDGLPFEENERLVKTSSKDEL